MVKFAGIELEQFYPRPNRDTSSPHICSYRSFQKPSIAAVNDAARDGGMTLAVSGDAIIASDEAIIEYPAIDLGLGPRNGSVGVVRACVVQRFLVPSEFLAEQNGSPGWRTP